MKFCPKCGALMLPKKEGTQTKYACPCGHSELSGDTKITSTVKTEKIEKVEAPKETPDAQLPICEMECEKCGHKECYFWEIQTRAGDEPPTRFYKCVSCSHTWREYT